MSENEVSMTDQTFQSLHKKRGRPASAITDRDLAIAIDTEYMTLRDVAKKWDISVNKVVYIRNKQSPDFIEEINKKRKIEMTEKLWEQAYDTLDLSHEIIRKGKTGETKVSLREASVHYGILIDKLMIMRGGPGYAGAGNVNIIMNIPDTIEPMIKKVEAGE